MKENSAFRLAAAKAWPAPAWCMTTFLTITVLIATALFGPGCGSTRPAPGGSSSESAIEKQPRMSPAVEAPVTRTGRNAGPPSSPTTTSPPSEKSSASGWHNLFDGKSLTGWKVTPFGGHGEVEVEDGQLVIHAGAMLTGISWTNEPPKIDYEVELETRKVEGGDFFCGVTFPVGDTFCSLIVGGWGGGVVGLSSIDGMDASENETTKYMSFPKDRWFLIKLRVMREKIEAWIDDEQMVDVSISGRKIALRSGDIHLSQPLGIATWQTTGALRNIRVRQLPTHP